MLTPSEVRDLLAVAGAADVDELVRMLEEYLGTATPPGPASRG